MEQIATFLGSAFGYSSFVLRQIFKKAAPHKPSVLTSHHFGGMVSVNLGGYQGMHVCESATVNSEVKLFSVSLLQVFFTAV